MIDQIEMAAGMGQDIAEKAREEIKPDIQEAESGKDRDTKQQELAKKLQKNLKDLDNEIKNANVTGRKISQDLNERAIATVAKAIEAAANGIKNVSKTPEGNELLKKLADKNPSDNTLSKIDYQLLPYLLGDKRIVIDGKTTQEFADDLKILKTYAPFEAELVSSLIENNADDFGISRPEFLQKTLNKEELEKKIEEQYQRSDATEQALKKKLSDEDKKFFDSLNSTDDFEKYRRQIINDPENGIIMKLYGKLDREPTEEENKKINETFSEELKERIRSTTYRIYDPVLKRIKTKQFEEAEREGTFYENPSYFLESFKEKLNSLKNKFSSEEQKGKIDKSFSVLQREQMTKKETGERYYKVLPVFEEAVASEFFQGLVNYAMAEHKRMSYGYNLQFILKTGAFDPEKGLMKSIAGFARGLNSSEIDEIYADKAADLVQKAILIFEQKNEQFLSNQNWRKDPALVDTLFQNLNNLEKDAFKEFKERYPTLEEWQIYRAVFNAQLMLYGVFFKPLHQFSYADPYLTSAGGVTAYGGKEMVTNMFDPAILAKRFQQQEPMLCGVDFLPYNINLETFNHKDWEKYRDAWKASFEKGKAAFYGVGGLKNDDFLNVKLFVDSGNLAGAGGIDTLARWRLFPAYRYWIKDYLNPDDTVKFQGNDTLIKMWKQVENIGSDALESLFCWKFGTSSVPDIGKDFKPGELDNIVNLFGFLHDRYFKDGIGKGLCEKANREDFEKYIRNDVLSSKDLTKFDKQNILKKYLYHALSVIMFERMPLKFLYLEKQRLTQNGSRLIDELYESFQFTGTPKEKRQAFDKAMNDLLYVQTELRINIINDMRNQNRKNGLLYGEEINGGKGYVINEGVIKEILGEEKKDSNAIKIFALLNKKIKELPIEMEWDKKNNLHSKYINRLEWFSKLYKDAEFGFSPTTGELAFSFLNFSASGDDTIERTANFCSDTAEKIAKEWNMIELLRGARKERSMDKVLQKVWEIRQLTLGQWGTGSGAGVGINDYEQTVAHRFWQRAMYFFRKDDLSNDTLDWAINKSSSFSEEDMGGPRTAGAKYEMTKNMLDKAITDATGASAYKLFESEIKEPRIIRKKWSEKHKILGGILEKIERKPRYVKEHDWANEVSGRALKHVMGSDFAKIFQWEVVPRILIFMLIIMAILGIKSFKSDFVIGGGGGRS